MAYEPDRSPTLPVVSTTRERLSIRTARSGWVPAVALLLAAALGLHYAARVSLLDIARFLGYAVGWLMLPGTLLWRLIDRRRAAQPLIADLAIGMLCGYVLEFPVYLGCLASGHPHLYVLWPAVVLLVTLTHRPGRALWTRPTTAMPPWWSWSLAGVLAYVIAWWTWSVWRVYPSKGPEVRSLYGDMYHHLMLSSELRFHFRPENADVVGTTLYYHWLTHLHVAASSWVTGIEPIVLLQSLVLPTMCAVVFVALACVVVRLTAAPWAGPASLLLLVAGPIAFTGWRTGGTAVLDLHLSISPSAGFVFGPLLLGLVIMVELIRGDLRSPLAYAFVTLCFVAMLGAKSTSLPIALAGLAAALVWHLVAERRIHRPALALTVLAGLAYLLAKPFFFGSGTGGVEVSVLGSWGDGPFANRAVAAVVFLLGYLSIGAPLAVALLRRATRSLELVLLAAIALAGFGGYFATVADGGSQWYFMYAGLLPLALGSGIALPRLVPVASTQQLTRMAAWLLALVVLVAVAAQVVIPLLPAPTGGLDTLGGTLEQYVLPLLAAALVAVLAAAAWWLVARRRTVVRSGVLVGLAAALGLGGASVAETVGHMVHAPLTRPALPRYDRVGTGGIEAARWLRAHSTPDTVVATNGHCDYPPKAQNPATCTYRNFWMAGFTERRFLVEGWSYITRELGQTERGPFWNPGVLRENDLAFQQPTPARLEHLHQAHGVDWLFVDKRYPVDLAGLEKVVEPAYATGQYVVFDLRNGVRPGH